MACRPSDRRYRRTRAGALANRLPQTAPVNTAATKLIDPAIAIIESVDRLRA
jgi:hypothetical protein